MESKVDYECIEFENLTPLVKDEGLFIKFFYLYSNFRSLKFYDSLIFPWNKTMLRD